MISPTENRLAVLAICGADNLANSADGKTAQESSPIDKQQFTKDTNGQLTASQGLCVNQFSTGSLATIKKEQTCNIGMVGGTIKSEGITDIKPNIKIEPTIKKEQTCDFGGPVKSEGITDIKPSIKTEQTIKKEQSYDTGRFIKSQGIADVKPRVKVGMKVEPVTARDTISQVGHVEKITTTPKIKLKFRLGQSSPLIQSPGKALVKKEEKGSDIGALVVKTEDKLDIKPSTSAGDPKTSAGSFTASPVNRGKISGRTPVTPSVKLKFRPSQSSPSTQRSFTKPAAELNAGDHCPVPQPATVITIEGS